jgi:hypothetical protein
MFRKIVFYTAKEGGKACKRIKNPVMPPKAPKEKHNDYIGSIQVVKSMRESDNAMQLLKQSANIVSPLLERRKWNIRTLTEFYPSNQSLLGLNVNRGQTIKIRLREPTR